MQGSQNSYAEWLVEEVFDGYGDEDQCQQRDTICEGEPIHNFEKFHFVGFKLNCVEVGTKPSG